MRVCVVGAGYVGLVSAACLADAGHDVAVIERDEGRIRLLADGIAPIYEPGLEDLLRARLAVGRLRFAADPAVACGADVVLLCVGTPSSADGLDTGAVFDAVREIAPWLADGVVVVGKSTVPVGTCARLAELLAALRPDLDFDVASNPEFLKEGAAVADFLRPARIVVGTTSARAEARLRALYADFRAEVLVMDPASAELTKVASNAMLAVRVSFVNEVAALCEAVGADVDDVRRAIGADPRIGPDFLQPSLGYGGSCLPKDVGAIVRLGREVGRPITVVEAAAEANRAQRRRFVARVLEAAPARVAVWGLAFKAGTDDVRESAALELIRALRARGVAVAAHDPAAQDRAREALGDDGIHWAHDAYDAALDADVVAVCAEWPLYRALDPGRVAEAMRGDLVIDGRNLLDPAALAAVGLRWRGIGRVDAPGSAARA